MDAVVAQVLAFLAVFAAIVAVPPLLRKQRASTPAGSKRIPGMLKPFLNELGIVGSLMGRSDSSSKRAIATDIRVASLALEVSHIRGAQVVVCLVAGISGATFFYLALPEPRYVIGAGLVGAMVGWIYPRTWLQSAAKKRQEEISRSLPYAIDLLTVAMTAGQDFSAALRHVVNEGLKGPLADEFSQVLREVELGKTRENALRTMEQRVMLKEFSALVGSVIQGSEMGASIAKTLKIQGEEVRRERFHRAERQAARAPSLMLLPMAIFILPAVFIIIFTPVILRAMESGLAGGFGE